MTVRDPEKVQGKERESCMGARVARGFPAGRAKKMGELTNPQKRGAAI